MWNLGSQTSLEAQPEIRCPPSPPQASDTMNPQENFLLTDSSVNSCDASGPKKGPPVAPKPARFLQSLRRIREEQNQRRQRKSEEQLNGIRSHMSIKQKISSFESFSSSSNIEQHRKERRQEMKRQNSASHQEVNREHVSGTDGSVPSSPTNQSSFPSAPAMFTHTMTLLPPAVENLDLHGTSSSLVLSNPSEEGDQCGGSEGKQGQGKIPSANGNKAPPIQGKPLESEGLETIITISNQVSQTLMHFLPTSCHPELHPPSVDDSSSADLQDVDSSNRVFSFSLAALRNEDEGFPSSPDLSILSDLPSHCLQKIEQEIHHLDQETLKRLKDVHIVIFQKEDGVGLGFSIAGGCDLENKDPTVHKVFPGGVAAVGGVIEKGDVVLSINGETLYGVTHSAATAAVRHTRNLTLVVVVVYKTSEKEREERRRDESTAEEAVVLIVELEKVGGSVGFTLEGGKGSIHGDRPLVINRIFKGGAAEQRGLQCGNELLKVQDVSVVEMSRFEAWNLIKALPEGPVTVMVRRTTVD